MKVTPRLGWNREYLRGVHHAGQWLVVECEVTDPPSAEGRKALLVLDDEQARLLLTDLRRWLVKNRSTPEVAR